MGRPDVMVVMVVMPVMVVTGEIPVTNVEAAIIARAVKAATTAITVTAAITATIATTGGKNPLPTAKTTTDPQAVGSLTVPPVLRMANVRSATTATVRVGGLRVLRVMTGLGGMTAMVVRIVMVVRAATDIRAGLIGKTVQTAVRTGRIKTTVAVKTVPQAVGAMVGIAVTAVRTNALARVVASPNRPIRVLTTARQRNQCGS